MVPARLLRVKNWCYPKQTKTNKNKQTNKQTIKSYDLERIILKYPYIWQIKHFNMEITLFLSYFIFGYEDIDVEDLYINVFFQMVAIS